MLGFKILRVINMILLTFKVMGFSLFLIDSEQANLNKLDRKGLLHLGRIDKVKYIYKRIIGTLVYDNIAISINDNFCCLL